MTANPHLLVSVYTLHHKWVQMHAPIIPYVPYTHPSHTLPPPHTHTHTALDTHRLLGVYTYLMMAEAIWPMTYNLSFSTARPCYVTQSHGHIQQSKTILSQFNCLATWSSQTHKHVCLQPSMPIWWFILITNPRFFLFICIYITSTCYDIITDVVWINMINRC